MYQIVVKLLNVEAVELQAITRLTFCDRTIFHLMMYPFDDCPEGALPSWIEFQTPVGLPSGVFCFWSFL